MGCKEISRILKVKYPEGTVLSTYGTLYKPGLTNFSNDLFCGQHSCRISDDGYIYLYNNNSCQENGIPRVLVLKEPADGNGPLEKVWEYQCTFDDIAGLEIAKSFNFRDGGDVVELPGHSFFVCMPGFVTKLFIVNRDKEIVWSSVIEQFNPTAKKWEAMRTYRANMITTRKDLERLIWNSEESPSKN